MKFSLFIILLIILQHCSFDTKTGIWENNNEISSIEDDRFEDFKTLFTEQETFNQLISPPKNYVATLEKPKVNLIWHDEFYNSSNNLDNFSYQNLNKLIFKSKRITKHSINKKILFSGNNIIVSDKRGNIILYSVENQKIIYKFNFYKKKFKKIKKNINLIYEKNIIYASDNIGYLYAIDYLNNKILWAKNFKKPFRSNLKIMQDKLVVADQDNTIYIINKKNGKNDKIIPTEEVILKNNFLNSFVADEENFFYLNTYGSLYSINNKTDSFEWFLNLNSSSESTANNLFKSNPMILHDNNLIISADPFLYIIDKNNGRSKIKVNISSIVKPTSSAEKIFIITKDNLLICFDVIKEQINFSVDINQKVSTFLNTRNKKSLKVKNLIIVNNHLYIFLKNSYLIKFNLRGDINDIDKLPAKINSMPIFINNSILYLDNKNRLIILN